MRRLAFLLLLYAALQLTVICPAVETSAEEANIAKVTASLLGHSNFAASRFQTDFSAKFLERYLDALDGAKAYFVQSDIDDFAPYRATLETITLRRGDTSPAQKIFTRYMQRLEQRVAFAQQSLKDETFDFTADETYLLDRSKATRSGDIKEAEQLWRQHLRYEYLEEKLAKKSAKEIVETLSKRYERMLRTMKKLHPDQVFEIYLTALAHVYDPHSDYLGPRQLEDFNISMSLSIFGIGAVLQSVDGYCKIHELLPGGPAMASKTIKPGDRIVTVAQDGKEPVDIVEMPLNDAVQLIRGPKGTKVTLTLIPAEATDSSARKILALVRDEIKLEQQEAKARIVDMPTNDGKNLRLGIIDLPLFYSGDINHKDKSHAGATADVLKLIEKLKQEKIEGLILDLRLNGGGSLEEAIKLTGLFIDSGPIVQTKDADGHVDVEQDIDPKVQYDGPLVVLTSRLSASASEILSGALQDYGRALIVGDKTTFGKGTVQSMLPLAPLMKKFGVDGGENPGALKLTIRAFFRPGGSSTQLKGVSADLVLPSALAPLKIGEAEMPDSLPWDKVPPAKFAHLNRVAAYLPDLQKRSETRLATDQDYTWLQEDIERFRQQISHPVVSLNEKKRLKEKTEQEAREESRKKSRMGRKLAAETQYEITIKKAALPGLPEPIGTAGTNVTTAATTPIDPTAPHDTTKDDKTPSVDITLREAKHILADYIELSTPTALDLPKARTAMSQ